MSHHVRTATVAHHNEDQPRQDKIEDVLQKLYDTKLWGISIAQSDHIMPIGPQKSWSAVFF